MQTNPIEQLKIAEIPISIYCQTHPYFSDDVFNAFRYQSPPEVQMHLSYNRFPHMDVNKMDLLFDSQTTWRLYKSRDHVVFIQKSTICDYSHPLMASLFKNDYCQADVYIQTNHSDDPEDIFNPHPLDYPLGQIWMISLLARNRGAMFHACGVDDQGDGLLFTGNSTHGKSTMANLWIQNHAQILNDDRVVVRQVKESFRIYGTPWHGDISVTSSHSVPLKKIFIIRHADKNQLKRVEGAEALSMLIARMFPVIWDKSGMEFTLDLCARMAEEVPCYELGFKPDSDIIDFVRCAI
ncbi:hypothetical protein JW835_04705 [bacterium]|nr:hypothetical protein [bacterium]RQV97209.1 MAG: hypothetical protein EH221_04020 [bacterium]